MKVFVEAISNDIFSAEEVEGILPLAHCNSTQFISGALKAFSNAPSRVRQVIQSDIATTLNCQETELAFLWAHPVRGAETLDCEIPDFRDSFLRPMDLKIAAE